MIPGMEQAVITFVNESKELLEEMESDLLLLEEQGELADQERIHSVFRAIHTIKGSAGIFGFEHIVSLTHISETILDQIRTGETRLNKKLLGMFLDCRDLTLALVEDASQNQPPEDMTLHRVRVLIEQLEEYQNCICNSAEMTENQNQILTEPLSRPDKRFRSNSGYLLKANNNQWHISFRPEPTIFQRGFDPLSCIRYLARLGQIKHIDVVQERFVEVAEFNPELCYLGFEVAFLGDVTRQQLADVFEYISADADITIIPPASAVQEYIALIKKLPDGRKRLGEILVRSGALSKQELQAGLALQSELKQKQTYTPPIGSMLAENGCVASEVVQAAIEKQSATATRTTGQNKTLRVEAQKLDTLLDQVGEMVITGARANLLASGTGNQELMETMSSLARLVENIHDSSLKLRMVQIGSTFNKYKRVVRDIADNMGKKVRLEIRGEQTELDKTFVEKIGDPLMHIVRNAIDHGIETPKERLDKGKLEVGRILLNSYHESGSVVIEVSDDGKGIDKAVVLQKAIEKGMLSADTDHSDRDIYRVMFEPGFSTAGQVTSISGRGVGLDVVKRNIDSLRGTIAVESQPGCGSTMRICLPLTLSIIDGFMFEVDNDTYVIPMDTVAECMGLHEIQSRFQDQNYVSLRGELLPVIRLRKLFGIQEKFVRGQEVLVIVRFSHQRAGIVIDCLKGELQTVVKPLGGMFRATKCFSGATILGNGEVAMILDVPALIEAAISNTDCGQSKEKQQKEKLSENSFVGV